MISLKMFEPLINILPEIQSPLQKPELTQRLKWTGFALLVFATLGIIKPIGLATTQQAAFLQNLQLITASKIGTLATLGIGPIVMASIILQLLNGAGVFKFDTQNANDRQVFQGLQKLTAIFFCFFEAAIYVLSGFLPAAPGVGNALLVILQLAFAALLLLYLDEIVGKYGIGSGVGLFIAAGVSFNIMWGAFSWSTQSGQFIGQVPLLLQALLNGSIHGGALLTIISTLAVFLAVVYAESMKIEIPITLGRIGGGSAKYPIKFFYVSNIPVIFAAAIIANIQLWGIFLQGVGLPLLGKFVQNQPVSGLAYYIKAPYGLLGSPENIVATLSSSTAILNIIVYTIFMVGFSILFGKFWVELNNMGPKAVAKQLQNTGWQIPGFRRDPRVIEKLLERYIPMITILGSASVGLLAVIANLTGTLGTGTGMLLTVGILYKLYEELAAQQAFEIMPMLKGVI